MAQFARPDADTDIGAWTDEGGGTVNIFDGIDETVAEDVEFVQSELNPSASFCVFRMSDITDPQDPQAPTVRFRAHKEPSGGATVQLTVELREGYISEASPGTVIRDDVVASLPDAFTDFEFFADMPITDFSDLFLRLVAQQL